MRSLLIMVLIFFIFASSCKQGDTSDVLIDESLAIDSALAPDPEVDSIISNLGLEVKTELKEEEKREIITIIKQEKERSFLAGKTPEESIKLYENFVTKYDVGNENHHQELRKWTEDRLHQDWIKKLEWYREKKEELDDVLWEKSFGSNAD